MGRFAKKSAATSAAPTIDPTDELGGLTSTECPFDCSAERCVISGTAFCAHPNKGGADRVARDPEATKRYQKARKRLAMEAAGRRE